MSVTAGALSGLIVRFCIAPIDIIKIRLQLYNDPVKYRSISSTILAIARNEGIRAFWKGNIPAEFMYIIYGGSQFLAFTTISNLVTKADIPVINSSTTIKNVIVGASAGVFATSASYPLDLLRTRLASHDKHGFHSVLHEIRNVYRSNGVFGFFNGASVGMFYVALSTGLSFGSYSFIINHYDPSYFPVINSFIDQAGGITSVAGLSAGIISKTLVYPLDLLKRRLQMSWGSGMLDTLQTVLKTNGVMGLYRGLLPALLKSAPATGISLYCYEFFIQIFKQNPF